MKKFLPLILLLAGILILVGVYFLVFKKAPKGDLSEDTSNLIEVALVDRPIASLTPSADGHWLALRVENIKIDAESMDYELLYEVADGRTQGVPGNVLLSNIAIVERDLLLGSESSGKFRYDEGVEKGTLTLRFRDSKGRLMAKFATDFSLVSSTKSLASLDGKFKLVLDRVPSRTFFVVMETFGVGPEPPGELVAGPYGVFSSSTSPLSGTVSLEGGIYAKSGASWSKLSSGKTSDVGIFIGVSE